MRSISFYYYKIEPESNILILEVKGIAALPSMLRLQEIDHGNQRTR